MPLYHSLVENLILPAGDVLLNTAFIQELRTWRELDRLSPSDMARVQEERLARLLQYAGSSIPFYQKLAIPPKKDVREWLRSFPVMHKPEIKAHLHDLVNGDPGRLVCEKSSGSSGIQGEVYMSRQEQFAALAAQTHLWEWAGYRLGDPLLQLGMTLERTRMKAIKDRILRTNYQQAFTIDEAESGHALRGFSGKNGFFGGYASGLYAYACLAERLGIEVEFKGVISWGDKMFDHYRRKIEKQFHTHVYDTYGTTEGFMIAGQCGYGHYHVLSPAVYLELLDNNGREVQPGEIGQVVVTRLDAYAMPLIRYALGDLAIRKHPGDVCPCGKPYPLLEKIIGRDTDIVRTPGGKYMIVHFFTGIFEHIPEIRQFRVIQHTSGGINIEYIPDIQFKPEILEGIASKIRKFIQEPFQIDFTEVESIPPTPSGKPQIIASYLNKP